MKFLADANMESTVVYQLRLAKHDVKWVAEDSGRLEDTEVLEIARRERRVLLTNDKDFGELVFRQKLLSTGIVLFRVKGQDVDTKLSLFSKLLETHAGQLHGHFVVIGTERTRLISITEKGGMR